MTFGNLQPGSKWLFSRNQHSFSTPVVNGLKSNKSGHTQYVFLKYIGIIPIIDKKRYRILYAEYFQKFSNFVIEYAAKYTEEKITMLSVFSYKGYIYLVDIIQRLYEISLEGLDFIKIIPSGLSRSWDSDHLSIFAYKDSLYCCGDHQFRFEHSI